MTASKSEWKKASRSRPNEIPKEAKRVPYDAIKEAFAAINSLVESGEAKFQHEGQTIVIETNNDASRNRGDITNDV